jgi:hypothetical protein
VCPRHVRCTAFSQTDSIDPGSSPYGLITGFDEVIDAMPVDPGDRHVLAAAIYAGASEIVTLNIRHFPYAALSAFGIEASTPDEFLRRLAEPTPEIIAQIVRGQARDLRAPSMSPADVLAALQQFAPRFVEFLYPFV